MDSGSDWSNRHCEIRVELGGDLDRTRIVVTGELDIVTLPALRRVLAGHPPHSVEVEASGVSFASVAAAALVSSMRADGARLAGSSAALHRTICPLEQLDGDLRQPTTATPSP